MTLVIRVPRRAHRRPRRRWLGLLAAFLVASAAMGVYLHVTVTARFEGRLWALPSRIYSDALVLERGRSLPAAVLQRRLVRSGYAETTAAPQRPGQFRRDGASFEIRSRAFSLPGVEHAGGHFNVRLAGDHVSSLKGADGRWLRQAAIEPELLATLYGERHEERELIRLSDTPGRFVQAVLAAEDSRFFRHHGLDVRGIARAAATNVRKGKIVQGGSTITQQTVKNLFLSQRRTWWRKIRELLMSVVLDGRYSKERILEVYLNEVYWGQRGTVAICGAQAAARYYFGRNLADLRIGEWAMLAGLIRSPGSNNPFKDPERARARRDQVLDAMLALGMLDLEQHEAATRERLELARGGGGFAGAPYLVDFVRQQLAGHYSDRILAEQGLRVYTTLDTVMQERAEQALESGLARLERDWPSVRRQLDRRRLQGVVLVTRPSSGEIVAMVGGRDYRETQFNRAVQASRQPGSCFKPFVFAAGFELARESGQRGLTPATPLEDSPLELVVNGKLWSPTNYDRDYRGWVPVRQALEESLNVPTIRAGQRIGLERVVETARRCGIRSALSPVPSLPLGTEEVTPLELATAYATLAQQGVHTPPWSIRTVTDRHGVSIGGGRPESEQMLSPESAYLMTDLLRGVFERGTAKTAAAWGFHGTAAGKTGTTDDTRDAWFVGYTPELLGLVWVGYDDNASTGLTGATGALPIWVDVMRTGSGGEESGRFDEPRGIVARRVDPDTGQLATSGCPRTTLEIFAAGSAPEDGCALHRGRFKRWWRKVLGRDT